MSPIRTGSRVLGSRVAIAQTALAVVLAAFAVGWVLKTPPRPLSQQPGPDAIEYADGGWQLGHGHGYVTFFDEHKNAFGTTPRPPRYPFGTAVALAPFSAVVHGFPRGPQLGARVITVLFVLAMIAAAWLIGGPLAAAIVALLISFSPFTEVSATIILSDALAALLTVCILIALTVGRGWRTAVVAGGLAGALICVRLLGVVSLPAVMVALTGRRRVIAALAAAPFVGALGLYQWQTFGSPFRTGYSYWVPGLKNFSLSYLHHTDQGDGPFVYQDKLNGHLLGFVCPCGVGGPMSKLSNLAFYPSVLADLFWVFAPPLTGLIGLWQVVVSRTTPAARFALVTVVCNAVLVCFYFYTAARFLAPAASLLTVYASVALARLLGRVLRTASELGRGGRAVAPAST